jgi:glutamate--cysteine ligase catalytic subunit
MVESTPGRPYTGYSSDLTRVERNMIVRRRRLLAALAENEISPTVTFTENDLLSFSSNAFCGIV